MVGRILFAAVALALVAVGCTGGDNAADGTAPAIVGLPTPETAAPGQEAPTPQPEGRIIETGFLLETQECFNTYDFYIARLDETRKITTVVDCRRPHEGEVFASYTHPAERAAPYPGSAAVVEWGNIQCLDSFDTFIGRPFVLSALQIGLIRPTAEEWEGDPVAGVAPTRLVHCYVFAPEAQLSGSMSGSEL
jgi:hypothetical protein